MNRHSFTYPQYCPVVEKNVIIEELTFLSGRKKIPVPETRREGNGNFLEIINASENNLKNVNVIS